MNIFFTKSDSKQLDELKNQNEREKQSKFEKLWVFI
jgi:hypothetical protein